MNYGVTPARLNGGIDMKHFENLFLHCKVMFCKWLIMRGYRIVDIPPPAYSDYTHVGPIEIIIDDPIMRGNQ